MNLQELKRARFLSNEVLRLTKSFEKPKQKEKPKDLDFLNKLTGLNIPKKKVIAPPKPIPQMKVVEKKVYLGKTGEAGKDGIHGHTPTKSELIQLIKPLIPEVRNGVDGLHGTTPKKGVDYLTQEEINHLKEEIKSEIKLPEIIKGDSPTIDEAFVLAIVKLMKKLPEKDRLEVQDIRNASSFMYKGTKYQTSELMHGAGSSSSGSTLSFETPVGAVDDSNTTFTVSHTPLYINVNGQQYTVGNGQFVSYVAPTITLLFPVGTGGFIQSAYNS